MADSYLAEGVADRPATFDLTCRALPQGWGYLVAAGLDDALTFLEELRFGDDELTFLASTGRFRRDLLNALRRLRFTGDVRAVSEGTVVYRDEPLVEVTAPLIEAQLVETAVLNHVHFQTVIASKAARCVEAAEGRTLVDFSLRRAHGLEAGLRVARASWLAGFDATSNVRAGQKYRIPVAGTMAHSYVECFRRERDAFEAFVRCFPHGSTLLVDTYDTLAGTRRAADVAQGLAACGGSLAAIRLDSGDLDDLSRRCRTLLDEAGLPDVGIFVSGNLDEHAIARLVSAGAPIDGFGVGSRLGVSADAPFLDMAYKLVEFDGEPTVKLSAGKRTLPGRKQVWRASDDRLAPDVLTLEEELPPDGGIPLLETVLRNGQRLSADGLEQARERTARERETLPRDRRLLYAAETHPVLGRGLADLRARTVASARACNPSD
jgi:nicotinate phosphoribosyltransferase